MKSKKHAKAAKISLLEHSEEEIESRCRCLGLGDKIYNQYWITG